jgi:putative transcriptional regulator
MQRMTRDDSDDLTDHYLAGKLLIATPSIGDPRFDRAVILMCDHTDEHAMGIIINKALDDMRLPDLLEQLGVDSAVPAPDLPVLLGGPVDSDRGFVLHSPDFMAEGSTLPVNAKIALTATKDVLEAIASASPPRQSLMALGYAGWGAGQLENELAANAWLVTEPDEALIFDLGVDQKWEKALESIGVTPEHLSVMAGHA